MIKIFKESRVSFEKMSWGSNILQSTGHAGDQV